MRKIIENFFSLASIQIFNYILPLITIPYLIRSLGLESFGILVSIQVIIGYLKLILHYGFQLTAVDAISKNITSIIKVNKIASTVILTKLLIFVIVSSLLLFCLLWSPYFKLLPYILVGLIEVFSMVFYLDWYLQGIQEMKYLALIEFVAKLCFTVLIFTYVHDSSDLILVLLSNSTGYLVASMFSVLISTKLYSFVLKKVQLKDIINELKQGFEVFLAQMFIPLYSSVNIIFLGMFVTPTIVGAYSSSYKIFEAFRGLSRPFNRALFPYLSNMFIQSKKQYTSTIFYTILIIAPIFLTLGIIIYILATWILTLFMGSEINEISILVLKILSIAIMFVPFGPYFTQLLLIEGHKKKILYIVISTVVLNIILVFILMRPYGAIGLALQVVLLSAYVPIANYYIIKKYSTN